ncbi:MAG: ABC-F family ATP-binding cassette domain-containing protein [Elusimicrobia bacterium]|nr:ABC-F family ATP-binding cassette domain-containing protein [Elusimicrobiota bacterium]
MAILLSCRGLSKSHGVRPLFSGLSFGLYEGERTGLIGPNGAGKSTLLRILAGQETADEGEVSMRRGLRVGYLPQQDRVEEPGEGLTVGEAARKALDGLDLQDYEVDMRVEHWLERAGFPPPETRVDALSGGWRKRLAILREVLREPDLLLLDEPTNHLDLDGVRWLEGFLGKVGFPFLVVTHDRRFLERVCNRVIELNKRYADGHFSSAGPYSAFLEKREALFAEYETNEAKLKNAVRGEIEWLRKGPKARTTKQQARIDRAGAMIEDLAELKSRNLQGRATDIDFTGTERRTTALARFVRVEKSLGGRKLFGPLDLTLGPGDRLGLLGGNGSGKTTLLRLLAGTLEPDAGEVKRVAGLRVVVFDQHRARLDPETSLKRALCPAGEHVEFKGARIHVYGWAARFLFRQDQMEKPLRVLSGGEQARVLIANLMREPADLLLLDEPTNDLDLPSLEVLEASLAEFPGAVVLVTHDRYLLDRVSSEILALDGRGGANYYADLGQWEDRMADAAQAAGPAPSARPAPAAPAPALTPKEAKELRGMESAIKTAEEKAEAARAEMEDPAIATDAAALAERHEKHDAARRRVDELYARWSELEARR